MDPYPVKNISIANFQLIYGAHVGVCGLDITQHYPQGLLSKLLRIWQGIKAMFCG
jgi:hypothetical protein